MTLFDLTQVAEHNDDAHGYWLIIDGTVYDVSKLMRIHPGGPRILQLYAGRDATAGFRRIHRASATLSILLARTRLGRLRELPCHESAAARALASALSLVVEMQNALRADHAFRLQNAQTPRSRYELQRGIETHARFQCEYLDVLIGVSLRELATSTLPTDAHAAVRARLEQLQCSRSWVATRAYPHALLHRFESITDAELDEHVARFELMDSELLCAWKRALSHALRELERQRPPVDPAEADAVLGVSTRLLDVADEYIHRASS